MEQQSITHMLRKRECFGNEGFACIRTRCVKNRMESVMDGQLLSNGLSHYQDLKPQPRSTIAADFDPEGRLLASTHGDHTVKLFEWGSLQPVRVLSGHRRTPWVIRWHPTNCNMLVTGSLDSDVRFWNTQSGRCVKQRTFEKPIASMAFHPQGDLLAVAAGHRIFFWRWEDDQLQPKSVYRAKKSVRAVAFHPHGHPLFITAEVNDKRGEEVLRSQEKRPQNSQSRLLEEVSMAFSSASVACQRVGCQEQDSCGGNNVFAAFSPPSEADLRFRMPNYAVDSSAHPPTQQVPQQIPQQQSRMQLQQYLQQQLLMNPSVARLALTSETLQNPLNFAPFTFVPPPPPASPSQNRGDGGNWGPPTAGLLPPTSYTPVPMPDAATATAAALIQSNGMVISPTQYLMEVIGHRHQMQGFPPLHFPNNLLQRQATSEPLLNQRMAIPPTRVTGGGAQAEPPSAVPVEELPVTTIVKLWHLDESNLSSKPQKLTNKGPILTIPNAVLCSEMGLHISPCGKYLALCCAVAHPSPPMPQPQPSGGQQSGSWPPIRVGYELRVYSIETHTVMWRRAVRVGMCLTSVQWSPSSEYLLVAYGRRHIALVRDSLDRSDGSVSTTHTIMEIYRVQGMKLVCVLPSSEDEVNVATWHPIPGEGIVYGTKEGRLRIIKVSPPKPQPQSTDQNAEQPPDRDSVVTLENEMTAASDDE